MFGAYVRYLYKDDYQGGRIMNNQISERRIRNNKKKRCRQLKRHLMITVITSLLTIGISGAFFSIGSRAQAAGDHNISYKYYKSVTVASGETLWNYADQYADSEFYDSHDDYIKEVMNINHMKKDTIIYGQHIILPYYSDVFVE